MQSITLTRTLDSETLHLPELRPFVGHQVEITIRESSAAALPVCQEGSTQPSLVGSVLRDDDPFGPAVPAEVWEACQ